MSARRAVRLAASMSLLVAVGGGGAAHATVDPVCDPSLQPRPLCPNLRVSPIRDLTVDRTPRGHVLLRATSSLDNRGRGPLELRGTRVGTDRMRVRQLIRRRGASPQSVPLPGARLVLFDIPGQGGYWKFHEAARFELWRLRPDGERRAITRLGPKLNYCFRDLQRRHPTRISPRRFVYPACSQDASRRRVTLGTSVGWSDVYPAPYFQQYIDVTGLRGCFAYLIRADPSNHLHERREGDDVAVRTIRLPFRRGYPRGSCPKRSRPPGR